MKRKFSGFAKAAVLAGTIIAFFGTGVVLLWVATFQVPDLQSFEDRRVSQSTKIYDRTGEVVLFDIHANAQRTVVPFEEISPYVKNATIAIEDASFYQHFGVRPLAFLRAVFVNIATWDFTQGGSTITQQVVKNALLTKDKKIARKIKEWVLALKVERMLTKDEILAIYLNESPYGGNLYGVEEASKAFFGKSAHNLTLAEAAYLAALPQAPTYYSPYGNNRDKLDARKNLVLKQMVEEKLISEDERAQASAEEVVFKPRSEKGIEAPHFVMFVREYLENTYGKSMVETGGLRVVTTLDANLQRKAEEIVNRYALQNETQFNAENASLVAIDPKTGQIKVMVGSRDYHDTEIDGNFNVALAKRQPGSAFKPFAYVTAFEKGYSPDTVVFDLKTQFSTACGPQDFRKESPCFSPDNYDNVFRGPISLRNSLAQSVNVSAVKVLYLAGPADSLATAKAMGITSLPDWRPCGLALVLGCGEVTLLEMTSAYGVFANEGARMPHTSILRIEDSTGLVLEEFDEKPVQAIDRNAALQISDVLSDNAARAPAFGENSLLRLADRQVAAKTGTTNEYRDAWIIGYTPDLAVGAWAGNNDNRAMEKRVAGFIVAPLWNTFMQEALADLPRTPFPRPTYRYDTKPILRGIWQGGTTYKVDTVSGKIATEHTPTDLVEERALTNVHSILHWVDRNDPLGPIPSNPGRDPQYTLWEYPIQAWANGQGLQAQSSDTIPTETDDVHHPDRAPKFRIRGIENGKTYSTNERLTIEAEEMQGSAIRRVEFTLNGEHMGTASREPWMISLDLSSVEDLESTGELVVTAYDEVQNKSEQTIIFSVREE